MRKAASAYLCPIFAFGRLVCGDTDTVDDRDYRPPLPFNGTTDRPQLSPEGVKKLEAATPGAGSRSSE